VEAVSPPQHNPSKPQNFDAHGRLFYQTLVLNDAYLDKLPVHNKFWRGIKHPDFNLQSFRTGKAIVYPLAPSWRASLEAELHRAGWDSRAVSSFLECLQVNGSKLELAVAIPGVPSGQHYSDKSGLVDIDTDHTPKASGNVEIKVNIGQFEQRLKEIHDDVADLRREFMKYAGGVTALQVMQNMEFRIDEFAKRIDSLSMPVSYAPVPAPAHPQPEVEIITPKWRIPSPETAAEARPSPPEKPRNRCPHLKHWDGDTWGCGVNFAVSGSATAEHASLFGAFCIAGYSSCPHFKMMEDIKR
jgi:hypothetical protein